MDEKPAKDFSSNEEFKKTGEISNEKDKSDDIIDLRQKPLAKTKFSSLVSQNTKEIAINSQHSLLNSPGTAKVRDDKKDMSNFQKTQKENDDFVDDKAKARSKSRANKNKIEKENDDFVADKDMVKSKANRKKSQNSNEKSSSTDSENEKPKKKSSINKPIVAPSEGLDTSFDSDSKVIIKRGKAGGSQFGPIGTVSEKKVSTSRRPDKKSSMLSEVSSSNRTNAIPVHLQSTLKQQNTFETINDSMIVDDQEILDIDTNKKKDDIDEFDDILGGYERKDSQDIEKKLSIKKPQAPKKKKLSKQVSVVGGGSNRLSAPPEPVKQNQSDDDLDIGKDSKRQLNKKSDNSPEEGSSNSLEEIKKKSDGRGSVDSKNTKKGDDKWDL